jgi:hypothetical protein
MDFRVISFRTCWAGCCAQSGLDVLSVVWCSALLSCAAVSLHVQRGQLWFGQEIMIFLRYLSSLGQR